jgi:hypothetical protein
VATLAAVWLRSYWRHDYLQLLYVHPLPSRQVSELAIYSGKGGVSLEFQASWWNARDERVREEYGDGWDWYTASESPDYSWTYPCWVDREQYGFGTRGRQGHGQRIIAPHALLLALLLVHPAAAWVIRRLRNRGRLAGLGLCPACGYDLRASPERCPECGRVRQESPQSLGRRE